MKNDMIKLASKGFIVLMVLSGAFFMDGVIATIVQMLVGMASITFLFVIFLTLTMQSGTFDMEIAKKLLIYNYANKKT